MDSMTIASRLDGNKQLTAKELKQEIQIFIGGASFTSNCNSHDLAKTCILLLKTLPAAREAVLEHLCHVFDEAIATHVNESNDKSSSFDETLIQDVYTVLSHFVTAEPEAWSAIISAWSLDLLGRLSSKYAGRQGVPHVNSSLTEVLQWWMTCRASRSLIDLTTQCISTLISTNPDMCIDALLDTSVEHSPHFDWVVAHIGSCFPNTIINRVLACGLKDFSSHDVISPSPYDKKVPKLASVVGILGHLAGRHSDDVRKALLSLFHESFSTPATDQQLATVPFLLQLASSDILLRVVAVDFLSTLTPTVLNQLSLQIPLWRPRMDTGELASMVVDLILRSEDGGLEAVQFLLRATQSEDFSDILLEVKNACALILDTLLLELQRLVYTSCAVDVPFLHCLQREVLTLCSMLFDGPAMWAQWLLPLLANIGLYGGERAVCAILRLLLTDPRGGTRLHAIADLLSTLEVAQPRSVSTLLDRTVGHLFNSDDDQDAGMLKNLLSLMQWRSDKVTKVSSALECIAHSNIHVFARRLLSARLDTAHGTADVLAMLVPGTKNASVMVIAQICRCVIKYFFNLLRRCNLETKIRQVSTCKKIVAPLSFHPATTNYLLRLLVEGAIGYENRTLFGSLALKAPPPKRTGTVLLSKQNRMQSTNQIGHSTIFKSMSLGTRQMELKPNLLSEEEIVINSQCLLDLLFVACGERGIDMLPSVVTELVSPDVMFNNMAWPEEEFTKITVERDLQVKRSFDEHPILWKILLLVTKQKSSLGVCSTLVRSLLAVAMSHWSSCQETKVSNCPMQLQFINNVMDLMNAGGLLPGTFSQCNELFPFLSPYEVYVILSDIWQYVRECVQSQNKDNCQEVSKINLHLHHILQKHIDLFGGVYIKFFPGSE